MSDLRMVVIWRDPASPHGPEMILPASAVTVQFGDGWASFYAEDGMYVASAPRDVIHRIEVREHTAKVSTIRPTKSPAARRPTKS